MSKDNLIGKSLGQFEIEQEVGRGGMATVYRARQQSMNRTVAVKVLPPHLLHDPSFYERFEREVDVIAHLEHPHILPIYDYGQSEGMPYIAMRFLGGGSMEQWIKRGLPDIDDLERPLRQIAQALDYAHQQGIIHRDLKPGNIMLDEAGNAYLSDFGIARVLGSDLTGSMIIGTPAYMSPEQANGLPIDARSDIYSLGIVLFELITGHEPYQAETPMAVLLKHINEPVPPLTEFRNDIPEEVNIVIQKATAKDPDDRYSSAGDMAKAFSAALRGETAVFDSPTKSSPPPTRTPVTPPPQPAPATAAPIPAVMDTGGIDPTTGLPVAMPKQRGLSRILLGVIGVLTVFVIGLVGLELYDTFIEPNDVITVDAIPTPFPRSSPINEDLYTINIPDEWIPPSIYIDQTQDGMMRHIWRDESGDALVVLSLLDAELTEDDRFFREAVEQYLNQMYAGRSVLHPLDQAVAEDGTVRRSYYLTPPGEIPDGADSVLLRAFSNVIQPGQIDVFFRQAGSRLVILEMFTAESTGNTLVTRMQLILDSLRVTS